MKKMQSGEFFSSQELKSLITSALLAIFGGFAKMFSSQQRLTFQQFLSSAIVSGFAGVMASYLVRYMNLPLFLQNFIIGMSGFAGPTTLKLFAIIYEEKLGLKRSANGTEQAVNSQTKGGNSNE
jgi:hypothetical protein